MNKSEFSAQFLKFIKQLESYVSDSNADWKIKGFIDANQTIFPVSNDTKLISKIIELHIFPKISEFASKMGFILELPDSQNYYPDLTFIYRKDPSLKYAVDIKTTFLRPSNNKFCGFTLGSHGSYFTERSSKKNIQYPYKDYKGHFVLGIIYQQADIPKDEMLTYHISHIKLIHSVINNLRFFFIEKWKIASDKQGSGNTANIGGILFKESDMLNGNGVFENEEEFDEYWMNYGKIKFTDSKGNGKTITNLEHFRKFQHKFKKI